MKKLILLTSILCICFTACNESELNQEQESEALKALHEKIKTLADSKTCENASDWKFTALGSKACGGPQEYIAYAINIDTVLFLELVTQYTSQEKEYNQKWGIMSDCSLPQEPSSVICVENKPVFNYSTSRSVSTY